MDDARLSEEIRHWLCETRSWQCRCRGAELSPCDTCRIAAALDAARAAFCGRDIDRAADAARRAAAIDGRLLPLRDELEERAVAAISLEGAMRKAPPRFSCGMTAEEHREITRDAIRREAELVKVVPRRVSDRRHRRSRAVRSFIVFNLHGPDRTIGARMAALFLLSDEQLNRTVSLVSYAHHWGPR